MIILFILVTILTLVSYITLRVYCPPKGLFVPDSYLLGILMYTIGVTIVVYFKGISSGFDVVIMAYISLISALVGCIVFVILFGHLYKRIDFGSQFSIYRVSDIEKFGVYIGLIISALVCIAFIYMVFQNSVVSALLSFATSGEEHSFLQARKTITSGTEGYFAPGFIKQFRDILIPIFLIALLLTNAKVKLKGIAKLIFYMVLIISIISMILAGQRSIVVILFLSLLIYKNYAEQEKRKFDLFKAKSTNKGALYLVILMFVSYGALTFLLGRAKDDDSVFDVALSIIPNLFERIFLATPGENIQTYTYWGEIGPTYGMSWLNELASVLPGVKSLGLSNQLHSLAGGSVQGNSPLGLPADIWFAWGWWGNVFIPFFYSILLGFIDLMLMSRRSVILIGSKIYLTIAVLKIYSPFGFILYGGVSVLILIFFVLIIRKNRWNEISEK